MKKIVTLLLFFVCHVNAVFSQEELFGSIEVWSEGSFSGFYGNDFADVNGDGKSDAIRINDDKIYVMLSDGNSFLSAQAWTNDEFAGTSGEFQLGDRTYFIDVTGDGKADAIAVKDDKIYVRRSDGSSFLAAEAWTTGPFNSEPAPGLNPDLYFDILKNFFADVNGDGLADAIVTHYNRIMVKLSSGNSFGTAEQWKNVFLADQFKDMNGDGMADGYNSTDGSETKTNVCLSNGSSFDDATVWYNNYWPTTGLTDVTGDGKADAINSHWHLGILVKISTGSGFLATVTGTSTPFRNSDYNTNGVFFSDVTGDGKSDAILVKSGEIQVRRSNFVLIDCSTDLILDNPAYLSGNPTARTIQTQGDITIFNGQSFTLSAVESIVFNPGFVVQNGGGLVARITTCEGGGGRRKPIGYESLSKVTAMGVPENKIASREGELLACSPNPAKTKTTIQYRVEHQGPVRLTTTDANGRLIALLVDEIKERGDYTLDYNVADLSPGIIYYSLETIHGRVTKKLIILK